MMIIKNNIPKQKRNRSSLGNNNSKYIGSSGNIIINSNTNVIDYLSSDSSTDALSARQGKILNDSKLSKNGEDTAKEKITFKKGLVTDGDIKSSEYSVDKGLGLFKDGSGNWNLEVDNIKARKRLNVQEINIDKAKYIGGALYCTLASMTVSKVNTIATGYRLYFNKDNGDGVAVSNTFKMGDMALCQTFNNNQVRRWWRGVTRTGLNFIDVDLQACEAGSDYPMVGDEVIQFGSANNRDRQGAVVIEPLSIKVYDNISTFKVPEPLIRLSPSNTKIDADKINFLGQTIINNKFIVADNGDVTMNNATMNNASVSGDLNLNTLRYTSNKVDEKGRLQSSFINEHNTYILPSLVEDEIRDVKIFVYRAKSPQEPDMIFKVENAKDVIDQTSYTISVQGEPTVVPAKFGLKEVELTSNIWQLYGRGRKDYTVWTLLMVQQT